MRLNNIKCNIELPDSGCIELKEHQTTYGDGRVESFVSIPERSERFSIHLTSDVFIAFGVATFAFINGIYQGNRLMMHLGSLKEPRKLDVSLYGKETPDKYGWKSDFYFKMWALEDLDITAADEESNDESIAGAIVIRVRRAQAPEYEFVPHDAEEPAAPLEFIAIKPKKRAKVPEILRGDAGKAKAPSRKSSKRSDRSILSGGLFGGLYCDGANDYNSEKDAQLRVSPLEDENRFSIFGLDGVEDHDYDYDRRRRYRAHKGYYHPTQSEPTYYGMRSAFGGYPPPFNTLPPPLGPMAPSPMPLPYPVGTYYGVSSHHPYDMPLVNGPSMPLPNGSAIPPPNVAHMRPPNMSHIPPSNAPQMPPPTTPYMQYYSSQPSLPPQHQPVSYTTVYNSRPQEHTRRRHVKIYEDESDSDSDSNSDSDETDRYRRRSRRGRSPPSFEDLRRSRHDNHNQRNNESSTGHRKKDQGKPKKVHWWDGRLPHHQRFSQATGSGSSNRGSKSDDKASNRHGQNNSLANNNVRKTTMPGGWYEDSTQTQQGNNNSNANGNNSTSDKDQNKIAGNSKATESPFADQNNGNPSGDQNNDNAFASQDNNNQEQTWPNQEGQNNSGGEQSSESIGDTNQQAQNGENATWNTNTQSDANQEEKDKWKEDDTKKKVSSKNSKRTTSDKGANKKKSNLHHQNDKPNQSKRSPPKEKYWAHVLSDTENNDNEPSSLGYREKFPVTAAQFIDEEDSPYATFVFKFRSKDALEKILGRSVEDEVDVIREMIENLSEDALHAMPHHKLVALMKAQKMAYQRAKADEHSTEDGSQASWDANSLGDNSNEKWKPSDNTGEATQQEDSTW